MQVLTGSWRAGAEILHIHKLPGDGDTAVHEAQSWEDKALEALVPQIY